jgi:hypothetical protein
MKLIIHVDKEYEENLLDADLAYTQSELDPNAFVVSIPLEADDDVLIESLQCDELVEFFGISSEGVVYTEVEGY